MATQLNPDVVLADSANVDKVWSKNLTITLGTDNDPANPKVTHADFAAAQAKVKDLNAQITDLRTQLDDLLNDRNDATKVLNGYNTRGLSAVRGIFGPNSSEYEAAGGTRSSERKKPVRKPKPTV